MTAASTQDKIAIVGAGPVGISMARALKQKGIAYDQYEADSGVGGNWRHGVYHTAHIISSRKTTEFPDFPMPAHYPDFPSAAQMLEYLNSYVEHYKLAEHIHFNTSVEHAKPDENGFWEVRLSNGETRLYDGLIICNGHHWDARWPKYEGKFEGEMIHSKDYKEPSQLKGKRVLVIGGGNSACDIAAESARTAQSAHLSLRRGYWFLPKTFYGKPTAELLTTWMPVWMQRIHLETLVKVAVGDYRNYGLMKPDHRIFDHHPTINTELLHYLKHGKIKAHPDVKRFDGKLVEFADGTREEIDLIVCGTGFNVSIPFLEPGVVDIEGSIVKTQWGVIAPHHRQLYIYGWAQARYGFGPLLTPASDLIADLILLQRKLVHPIGEVLARMKQPLPKSHLLDPMAALRMVESARLSLWMLPLVDKYLMANGKPGK
jgi:cation diffusion facilitator CzcD-associated flavoprotein CzcO